MIERILADLINYYKNKHLKKKLISLFLKIK